MAEAVLLAASFTPEVNFVNVLLKDFPNILLQQKSEKKKWITRLLRESDKNSRDG